MPIEYLARTRTTCARLKAEYRLNGPKPWENQGMNRRTALLAFVGLAGVITAQVLPPQTATPKTEKAQRFNLHGRVVDETGDPIQGVLIGAHDVDPDRSPPAQRFPNYTDEHGDFSLTLERGKYYIKASPIGGLDNQPEIHTDGSSGDPLRPTYYPSAANITEATPLTVDQTSANTALLVIRLLRQPSGLVAAVVPDAQKSASIAGIVVNQITGAPLAHVHVSLWNHDDNIHRDYGAMTNPDGTFSITGMPAVLYGIIFNHAGFSDPRPGRSTVKLLAGERLRGLKLPLVPTGSIAGRVVGPDGEPAEDINVYLRGKSGGQGSKTDEEGRFRAIGLLPGSYRLDAPPLTWNGPARFHPPELPATHWGAANYPEAIEVHAGSETSGIEVHLTRTPVVRVSGRVTGARPGVVISLSVNGRYGGFSDGANADGTFAWWNLDPGEYVIGAWEGFGSVDQAAAMGMRPPNSALMKITVADANIDNIELHLRPPTDISGQVEYETSTAANQAPAGYLRLAALDGMNGPGGVRLVADGHFTLQPLVPGRYRVMCDCGRPAYVKSMLLGSTQIEGDTLDLTNGPDTASLRVLLSTAFGAISGTVQGDPAAMANSRVVLVAAKPRQGAPLGQAKIDAGGRYSFDSVVPGEYQLAVVDDSDVNIQEDWLEPYRPVIMSVKVAAGESLIRNPKLK